MSDPRPWDKDEIEAMRGMTRQGVGKLVLDLDEQKRMFATLDAERAARQAAEASLGKAQAEIERLRACLHTGELAAQEAERQRDTAREAQYVPGTFRCPTCGFVLFRAGCTSPQRCPNDETLLQRQTWKESAEEAREVVLMWAKRAEQAEAALAKANEALTPSADTKAAYMGEFHFRIDDGERTVDVPWVTVKEIMSAIRKRAALDGKGGAA